MLALYQEFINTELYARVSVAVMFSRLAEIASTHNEDRNGSDALVSGKMFLLELLNYVVLNSSLVILLELQLPTPNSIVNTIKKEANFQKLCGFKILGIIFFSYCYTVFLVSV